MTMSQWPKWQRWFGVALIALMAAGCGLLPDVKDETAGWSAEQLYKNAHEAMLPVWPLRAAGDPRRRLRELAQ